MNKLTGNIRYRNWKRKIILQVEYVHNCTTEYESSLGMTDHYARVWKDATIDDVLSCPELLKKG